MAIHGYGASPASLAGLYADMPLNAMVVLPRAPQPKGEGWAWFMPSRGAEWSQYVEAIGAAGERLAGGLAAGVPGAKAAGRPIITGFSQGGMLSWTIATAHPDLVSAALPIGGLLPAPLYPAGPSTVPIEVFHGDADTVVSHAMDATAAEAVKSRGWPVVFHSYPGVGHTIPPAMRADYARSLAAVCR